MILKNRFFYL